MQTYKTTAEAVKAMARRKRTPEQLALTLEYGQAVRYLEAHAPKRILSEVELRDFMRKAGVRDLAKFLAAYPSFLRKHKDNSVGEEDESESDD
jgi:hypothetical protein